MLMEQGGHVQIVILFIADIQKAVAVPAKTSRFDIMRETIETPASTSRWEKKVAEHALIAGHHYRVLTPGKASICVSSAC